MLPNRRNSARSRPGFIGPKRSTSRPRAAISYGQAALEIRRPVELVVRLVLLAGAERGDELVILGFGERRVPVVVARALAVARRAKQARGVERIGRDDGGDRVEEGKRAGIQPPRDRARERLGGERARRNDAGGLEPGDLAPHHG